MAGCSRWRFLRSTDVRIARLRVSNLDLAEANFLAIRGEQDAFTSLPSAFNGET